MTVAEVALVGRDRELAHFDRRLEAVPAGSGGVVLVEADAGAGKTALAHFVVYRARSAGIRTAWGACLEGEGAAAYRPWVQLLRALGESERMLLEPAGGERGNRYRVFEHVIEVLGNGARESGLLLVIDDLHWADVPSMRLLQALAEQCSDHPLLVAGLYRGREAYPYPEVADGLRAIGRERASTALKLGGLTATEVSDLAARRGRCGDCERIAEELSNRGDDVRLG